MGLKWDEMDKLSQLGIMLAVGSLIGLVLSLILSLVIG